MHCLFVELYDGCFELELCVGLIYVGDSLGNAWCCFLYPCPTGTSKSLNQGGPLQQKMSYLIFGFLLLMYMGQPKILGWATPHLVQPLDPPLTCTESFFNKGSKYIFEIDPTPRKPRSLGIKVDQVRFATLSIIRCFCNYHMLFLKACLVHNDHFMLVQRLCAFLMPRQVLNVMLVQRLCVIDIFLVLIYSIYQKNVEVHREWTSVAPPTCRLSLNL
jgi:hypothetical protein